MLASSLFLLLFSCAQKKDVDDLDARLKALEEKVTKLESSKGGGAAAAAANPEEEQAASKLMQESQEAMKSNDYATAKSKLSEICSKFPASRACKASDKLLKEVSLIGASAAPMEVEKWFQGKADYSGSKATLIVFFESWCPHCKEEMPKLAEEEGKYKSKGIQIVGMTKVTRSSTDEKVTEFLKEHKVSFPVGKEKDGNLSNGFAVTGIPAAALVKDGKVIWRGHPARLNDELIDKLLAG